MWDCASTTWLKAYVNISSKGWNKKIQRGNFFWIGFYKKYDIPLRSEAEIFVTQLNVSWFQEKKRRIFFIPRELLTIQNHVASDMQEQSKIIYGENQSWAKEKRKLPTLITKSRGTVREADVMSKEEDPPNGLLGSEGKKEAMWSQVLM